MYTPMVPTSPLAALLMNQMPTQARTPGINVGPKIPTPPQAPAPVTRVPGMAVGPLVPTPPRQVPLPRLPNIGLTNPLPPSLTQPMPMRPRSYGAPRIQPNF